MEVSCIVDVDLEISRWKLELGQGDDHVALMHGNPYSGFPIAVLSC